MKNITIEDFEFKVPYKGFFPKGKRKASFRYSHYHGRAGVYAIKENGVLVYIGMTKSSVYMALYRHFSAWNPDRKGEHIRQTYLDSDCVYEVAMIRTTSFDALRVETALIAKHKPRDNTKYLLTNQEYVEQAPMKDSYIDRTSEDVPF